MGKSDGCYSLSLTEKQALRIHSAVNAAVTTPLSLPLSLSLSHSLPFNPSKPLSPSLCFNKPLSPSLPPNPSIPLSPSLPYMHGHGHGGAIVLNRRASTNSINPHYHHNPLLHNRFQMPNGSGGDSVSPIPIFNSNSPVSVPYLTPNPSVPSSPATAVAKQPIAPPYNVTAILPPIIEENTLQKEPSDHHVKAKKHDPMHISNMIQQPVQTSCHVNENKYETKCTGNNPSRLVDYEDLVQGALILAHISQKDGNSLAAADSVHTCFPNDSGLNVSTKDKSSLRIDTSSGLCPGTIYL
jgi:hypothetical protein